MVLAYHKDLRYIKSDDHQHLTLSLDNAGAWAIEVYPALLFNQVSEHVYLYIKLKLVIFSFI